MTAAALTPWADLDRSAPTLVATMRAYLAQIDCVLRPNSVRAADQALRTFATFLHRWHPDVTAVAQLQRTHVEDYKRWLTNRHDRSGHGPVSATTRALRLGALRMFFLRTMEWDWTDAPSRQLVFLGDLPHRDLPLPRALDDPDAAKFLRAAQAHPRLLVTVVSEVLIRTGLRVGELVALRADAIRTGHDGFWLHVPVGKLHDDRYLPLHPALITLIGRYRDAHVDPTNPLLLPYENGRPMPTAAVARLLDMVTRSADLEHIHPHQLRHTLATQAINRGMSMEAIAAMLGHHSLDMTRRYARLHDRTVADAYFTVADTVDALYASQQKTPVTALHQEMQSRLLGNGHCTRPRQLPCNNESVCENCVYFQTTIAFRPTLQAQHDDAARKNQPERQELFLQLLNKIDRDAS
jgi:site-specific recombinase XerD